MIRPADALDVQMALARMTRCRVSIHDLTEYEARYTIAFKFLLTLDEDELNVLAREVDSPSQFKEAYDTLKYQCLTRPDYLRER
ncbi:MAG: hypothetical protein DI625_08400 [Sphingomonas sp.]|jgi:hypothetical protein|nr:MAG: hypothetical protein DI625_08400 [Sphingomonas sp.]